MKIEVGRYEMDLDFDPRIQNNASDTMVPIDDIGFIYNCVFKQKKAFEYSVEAIRRVYRDSKIYVVSDGGLDYSYMEDENLKFSMEEDTVSPAKEINGDNFENLEYMSYAPMVKEEYRDKLPAITHVDGSARLQTVTEESHSHFYELLTEFGKLSETNDLLNTSFNIR